MISKSLLLLIIPLFIIASPLFANTFISPNVNVIAPAVTAGSTFGYKFTANNNLILTALGIYAASGITSATQIGIWDSDGTLLRQSSATPLGGTVINDYRYFNLANSLNLVAGRTYYIGAKGASFYPLPLPSNLNTQYTIDPAITITEGGSRTGIFGVPNLSTGNIPLSASAIFTVLATPEPETYLILGSLLGVMAFITAKKRRATS